MRRRRFNIVVREAQESVELMLKAALRWVGVEPSKTHDVSEILLRERGKFPSFFQNELGKIAEISRVLTRERGRSFYGDEDRGIPASELYSESDAREATENARLILDLCERLVSKRIKKVL
jgi:HEPN domain-containing protein